jgi:hypothetical protein
MDRSHLEVLRLKREFLRRSQVDLMVQEMTVERELSYAAMTAEEREAAEQTRRRRLKSRKLAKCEKSRREATAFNRANKVLSEGKISTLAAFAQIPPERHAEFGWFLRSAAFREIAYSLTPRGAPDARKKVANRIGKSAVSLAKALRAGLAMAQRTSDDIGLYGDPRELAAIQSELLDLYQADFHVGSVVRRYATPRGRPRKLAEHPRFAQFSAALIDQTYDLGGRFTLTRKTMPEKKGAVGKAKEKRGSGSLLEVLVLLRPLFPPSFIPEKLPLSLLERQHAVKKSAHKTPHDSWGVPPMPELQQYSPQRPGETVSVRPGH